MPLGRTNRRAFIVALSGAAASPLVAELGGPHRDPPMASNSRPLAPNSKHLRARRRCSYGRFPFAKLALTAKRP